MRDLHIGLNDRADQAMTELQERSGKNDADTVSRALQVHNTIETLMAAGNEIVVRSPAGRTEVLRILG